MVRRLLVASVLFAALAACGGGLASAKSDFKKGRYAEAKDELVELEPELPKWGEGRRAEYALYRGLVHAALGDRAAASRWLREAKAIEDAYPRTLSDDDRTRLVVALESFGPTATPPSP